MNQHHRFYAYARLLRLDRPIGNFLLLWPTLWALWLAGNGHPSPQLVFLFIVGVILMRGLGCIINDIADRNFDGFVARTKDRPLVIAAITLKEAVGLLLFLCFLAFCLVLQFNSLTVKLSFIGLALTFLYPYAKRFTYWPQSIIGLTFSWGIPMAFAAQTNKIPGIAWLLFITASLWTLAYDTVYAMVDRDDDRKIGIKSTALLLGRGDCLFVAVVQLSFMVLLACLGYVLQLRNFFYLGLGFAGGLLVYQQYLIKDRKPDRCFKAFLNNAWVGAWIFAAFFLGIRPG